MSHVGSRVSLSISTPQRRAVPFIILNVVHGDSNENHFFPFPLHVFLLFGGLLIFVLVVYTLPRQTFSRSFQNPRLIQHFAEMRIGNVDEWMISLRFSVSAITMTPAVKTSRSGVVFICWEMRFVSYIRQEIRFLREFL